MSRRLLPIALLGIAILLAACAPQEAAGPSDNFTHNVRLLDDGGQELQLAPGESVSFTFTGPGEHRYDCSFHPNDMQGVVIVTER